MKERGRRRRRSKMDKANLSFGCQKIKFQKKKKFALHTKPKKINTTLLLLQDPLNTKF